MMQRLLHRDSESRSHEEVVSGASHKLPEQTVVNINWVTPTECAVAVVRARRRVSSATFPDPVVIPVAYLEAAAANLDGRDRFPISTAVAKRRAAIPGRGRSTLHRLEWIDIQIALHVP